MSHTPHLDCSLIFQIMAPLPLVLGASVDANPTAAGIELPVDVYDV